MVDEFPTAHQIQSEAAALQWLESKCALPSQELKPLLIAYWFCPLTTLVHIVSDRKQKKLFTDANDEVIKSINIILREVYRRFYQIKEITRLDDDDVWEYLRKHNWEIDAIITAYCRKANTGFSFKPLMSIPTFMESEVDGKAPLFGKHFRGWLKKNPPKLFSRMQGWSDAVEGIYRSPLHLTPIPTTDFDHEIPRIIINDSIRTFNGARYQFRLATFLYSLWKECGNYSQSMSYLAGILLLTLNEQQAAFIMRKVNKRHIPGHWASQAVGFSTNAFVWDTLLSKIDPEIHGHFKAINFLPDTYLQKIFSALCIHVLEFDVLFDFIEVFLSEGFPFLLRFATALAQHFKQRLLHTGKDSVNKCFDIMKMDSAMVSREDHLIVLDNAKRMNIDSYVNRIEEWRTYAYENIIAPRLAKAINTPAFEPCCLCDLEKPDFFCEDCGPVCKSCTAKVSKGEKLLSKCGSIVHLSHHEVSEW